MLRELSRKIRNPESRIFKIIKKIIKNIYRINVPMIPIIHRALFYVVRFFTLLIRFSLQKVLWEPIFKSCCQECGKGLRLLLGMPLLSSHLRMHLGKGVIINGRNTFSATSVTQKPELVIGDNTAIGYLTSISVGKRVTIGNNCLLAERITICDNDGHPIPPNRRHEKVQEAEILPVSIGNNVWIGNGAFIGKGVSIGDGVVVGANSVVIHDVPANTVVGGIPAKVLRTFTSTEINEKKSKT